MLDQSHPLDDFLRKIDPLMESPDLYQSLNFACVAMRREAEWILVSGKALLSTEPSAPSSIISVLVKLDELLALSGRIKAETVGNLVANLKECLVVQGLGPENVRLTAEGAPPYSWTGPGVWSFDKQLDPLMRGINALSVPGTGPDLSSLLSPVDWEAINYQLRKPTPPARSFKDFDGLCGYLGLPALRSNLPRSSFQLSAELPARFATILANPGKGTIEIDIESVGMPELGVQWLPAYRFDTVPHGWQREGIGDYHHVSLAVPDGSTKAELTLSFAGLDVEIRTVEAKPKGLGVPVSAPESVPVQERDRWKPTGRTLGGGAQAKVLLVEDTRREHKGQWAQKRLRKVHDAKARERFGKEVKAAQSVDHPNVLKIIDSDTQAERPYYVAEYCEKGSLQVTGASRFKGNITATNKILLPIVDALVAAHQKGVFHRDIKPGNILFRKDCTPVIGDFGICYIEGTEAPTSIDETVGPRHFIAPEMESGGRLGPPSDRTDVYSLGKLLYWMLSEGLVIDRERHRANSLVELLQDQRWEHVHSLLDKMVTENPKDRIGSRQLKEQLQTVASLVEGDSAPLKPSAKIRCRFCGIGSYERAYKYPDNNAFSRVGLPVAEQAINVAGGSTALLRCGHCGHVEWFQLKGIASEGWWDR